MVVKIDDAIRTIFLLRLGILSVTSPPVPYIFKNSPRNTIGSNMDECKNEFLALRKNKTLKEFTTDNLLFMYVVDRANKKGRIEGQKKLMKLIFLAEHSLVVSRLKGLNYEFFKYSYGPFSTEVYANRDLLVENNFLNDVNGFTLEDRGREVLKIGRPFLEKNRVFTRHIDDVIDKYAKTPPWEIEEITKNIKINGVKIKDLPDYHLILTKLTKRQADMIFDINEDFIGTFDTMLNRETFDSLLEAIEMARRSKRLYSHEEVFQLENT